MPWEIKPHEGQFCVFKEGEDTPMHCYASEDEAKEYMAALYANEPGAAKSSGMKVAGAWTLEVLGVPFGGPNGGKDSYGEYFAEDTNLYLDQFPSPLVTYYHGFTEKGSPRGDPAIIGQAEYIGKRQDGHWWKVVLNRTSEYAKRIWEAARNNLARASSGSVQHLVRTAKDGRITHWPMAELALIDVGDTRRPANSFAVALPVMKALYNRAGVEYPEAAQSAGNEPPDNQPMEIKPMEPNEIKQIVDEQVAAALKASNEARKADEARKAELDAEVNTRVEAGLKAEREKLAAERRLHTGPYVAKFGEISKYDYLPLEDQIALVEVLNAAKSAGRGLAGPSEQAIKAAVIKTLEGKDEAAHRAAYALKAAGFAWKADEVMQQDLTGYGDEWVGIAYGTNLWESIRVSTFVLNKLPQEEVPQGFETMKTPLEGADPTWYKVAETTDNNATTGVPNATVTASKAGTSVVNPTLAKAGARVLWSGELDEDSLIPMLPELRRKMAVSGAEILEHVIIDGDTVTTATTNINDIAATGAQAGTEVYLLTNGFRKSPLVTTTANSRSAAGSLTANDFVATVKLMGSAGINALDITKVGFIIDPNVHWAALDLPEIKTRDVHSMPTIEGGKLTGMYGYPVYVSANMCRASASRLSNTAGKVDQDVVGNNLYGSILAVRWDQWRFGWKRRAKTTMEYKANSDSYEITSILRVGLIQRDTEASAITYYVGV